MRVRSVLARRRSALALGLAAFCLYAVTVGNLVGYEDETAAVTEGLVTSGSPRFAPGETLSAQGQPGPGGHRYSRTGLTQPVLEAPFYWVGERLDHAADTGDPERWRLDLLRLFNPAMAALTVMAAFALLRLRGVGERRATVVAALCAVGTLVWPYAKIGMDTTTMAMTALALLAAAWAAARPRALRFAAAGLAVALLLNAKPYGFALALGVVPLLLPAARALDRRRLAAGALAFLVPVLAGLAAVGWYNHFRTGSVTDFANQYVGDVLGTPFNVAGLFLSPGKGLVFYSPLVVLGALALRPLWRIDRALALAILVTVAANALVIGASAQWGDETWGPRYLVPSAWLLVLPLAWWVGPRRRNRTVLAVAAVAVAVQIVAVLPYYGVATTQARAYAGAPVYSTTPVPYGDDAPRWIPKLSPLLFQTELALAWAKDATLGDGFVVTYSPFRGHHGVLDLNRPEAAGSHLPDFWWTEPGRTTKEHVLAALLGVGAVLGAAALLGVIRSDERRRPLG